MEPSLETLRELLRACGFDLWYQLVNADDSYREWIDGALELEPAERLADATRRTNVLGELAAAFEGRAR
jgi:hypothetical protein